MGTGEGPGVRVRAGGLDRFAPAYLGLKPQAIQISPLRGAGGDKPQPDVWIARTLLCVVFLLLPLLAAASPPTPSQKAAIAALPDAYRAFLTEVEILLSDAERATFLALAKDYQRDAFIKQFWEVRDTVKRTARNELRESWESNLQQAKELFGDVRDGRARALLLNGPPVERVVRTAHPTRVTSSVRPSLSFRRGTEGEVAGHRRSEDRESDSFQEKVGSP